MENLWKICHEGRSFPKKNTWISTPFIQAGASEQWDTWTWYESEIIGITSSNYQITILEILSLLVGIFLVCIYIYTLQIYPCHGVHIPFASLHISTLLIPCAAPTDTPATRRVSARVNPSIKQPIRWRAWDSTVVPNSSSPRARSSSLNGPRRWPS